MDDSILGIAGRKQDPERRASFGNRVGKLTTIHGSGHDHVREQKVELGAAVDDLERLGRVGGRYRLVTEALELLRDIGAHLVHMRAERARALRSMMERDSLTGLLNHGRFKDRLAHELERCRRTSAEISLALIDLDHFKRVNDSYGHMSGDQVIRALSHALMAGLRRIDIIGRYAGEEFGVNLLDTPPAKAGTVIDGLRERFADIAFETDGQAFSSTFSAGIAGSCGHPGVDGLIEAVDRASMRPSTPAAMG
jgi:diguanylate cyclase (GGDEF)-like protein